MAAPAELQDPPGPDYDRLAAEQQALARGLQRKDVLNIRLLELGDLRFNMVHSHAALYQQRLRREADEKHLALGRCAAQLGVDLSKNRVDLHRWRQRTALLKVRLSSAHEDVDRYRRMGELMRRQYELEVAARCGSRAQASALAQQVVALAARMREQGGAIAALQADLLRLQETVAARDAEIAQQQDAMVVSSDQAQLRLAEAQGACRRLQEQVAAVQERAAAAEQTAAAAQERAKLAEQTLQQKEAVLVERERFQSDVQHFSQDLQKLARETSSVVDGKLQEQLAAAHAQLFEEKKRRADAEGEAQVQRAKAEQVRREVMRLQRSLAARDSLVQHLEMARLTDTPTREVTQTMELVGSLAADLAGTPATDFVMHQRSAAAPAAVEAAATGSIEQPAAAAERQRGKQQQPEALKGGKAEAKEAKSGKQATAAVARDQQPASAAKEQAGKKAVAAAAATGPPEPAAAGSGRKKKKKNDKSGEVAAKAQQAADDRPASAPASPDGSQPSWDDEDNDSGANPDFTDSKLHSNGGSSKHKKQQKQTAAALAAVAAELRPRRERKQAGAFWMSGGEQEAASSHQQQEEEEQQQERPQRSGKRSPAEVAEGSQGGSKKHKKVQAVTAELKAEKQTAPKAGKEGGDGSGKVAKRPDQASSKHPNAPGKKAATKLRPAAAVAGKENGEALDVLLAAAEHEQRQQQAAEKAATEAAPVVPTSRLEQRPLSGLTSRVLAAAAQRQNLSDMPITAQLQKVLAARSVGAGLSDGGSQAQPGKRKLLSVSSTFTLPGDAVPAHMMFGASKVPRRANNNNQL